LLSVLATLEEAETYTRTMYSVALRGQFDLLRMLRLTQLAWKPTARWHVGDLAWERRLLAGPATEWPTRLWLGDGGQALAWGWIAPPNYFELVVDPANSEDLILAVIDWAIAQVGTDAPLTTTVTLDQEALRTAFERRGFVKAESAGFHYLACSPAEAEPVLADGYILRELRGSEADLVARADVHIAAWDSKTMTTDVYRQLQRTWPYRADLDVVAEVPGAPDAPPVFAASCLAWLDEQNAVGELEPVGTHPAFRRRGLAAAVCSDAVRRLGALGATRAIVYATADPDRPGALALYRSIGFEEVTRAIDLRRN
jgi:ribosomal protein S18 acetylase RimI-like enzyme